MASKKSESKTSVITRKTRETDITLKLGIDGTGVCKSSTGVGFFDHMIEGLSRHGLFDIELTCKGDLEVDCHHTVEDVGIVFGTAIKEALGDKKSIKRYGSVIIPMDDALVLCAIDLSGRPYLSFDVEFETGSMGDMDTAMVKEFFYAVSYSAGMNIHMVKMAGTNDHHICECCFKAFARALDAATLPEPRIDGVLSTKGTL